MSKLRVDKIAAPIVKDEFTGSVFFDGTGDNLTVPASTDFAWGTADFTVEMWVYSTASDHTSGNHYMFDLGSGNLGAISYYQNKFNYYNTTVGSTRQIGGFPALEWHHIAVARENGTTRMFLDGVVGMSFADTHNYGTSALAVEIAGYAGGSTLNWQGYISNLRVCKGHAVYTGNFTVPTRELPVHKAPPKGVVFPAADNLTVLLACQSSTDATLDSSGRHTLTANGDVHAQSANPGLLRGTNISTTITENTGSVYFDGTGDYLAMQDSDDFNFGSEDFTVEAWIEGANLGSRTNSVVLNQSTGSATSNSAFYFGAGNTGTSLYLSTSGSSWTDYIECATDISDNGWNHIVWQRRSNTLEIYVNGILEAVAAGSALFSGTVHNSSRIVEIGRQSTSGSQFQGHISNLRVCKGHAVYTENFAVPTRELEVHQGPDHDRTVLLACYDGENIFADKTGRHIIAAYGDRLSSPTPTATDSPIGITTFNPGLTRNVDPTAGPTFQGGAGFTSQNWLTLPKGTTTERFPDFGAVDATSARGVFMGGGNTPRVNTIDYVTISTLGDATDFGDLSAPNFNHTGAASNTRGIIGGGLNPANTNLIEYITIQSTGNTKDFGDLSSAIEQMGGASNSTRCLFAGGYTTEHVNTIDFITISTSGNTFDFGDLTAIKRSQGGLASPNRALFAAGGNPGVSVNIDYVTIMSTGNAVDFGDISGSGGRQGNNGCSTNTRGCWGGGYNGPAGTDAIQYVTIATLGNAQPFGDLSVATLFSGATSSSTRGVWGGGYKPAVSNTIEYITMATLGDANNFGDLSQARQSLSATSSGHGGLG